MSDPTHIPLVSIIVPNYNYARYLKERMESIFSQTFTDYEIILLDDASSDNSGEILQEYAKDPRVTSLTVNETNSGLPFLQWKRGIGLARGKYVWIAESDDKADPEFLETCVKALENNRKAVIAFAGSILIDSNGTPLNWDLDNWRPSKCRKRLGKSVAHLGYRYATHNMIWKNYVYNASDTVFRRDAFDADKDYDLCLPMRTSGDRLFWTIMMKKGDVIEIYRKLNYFRRHESSRIAVDQDGGIANGHLYDEDIENIRYIFNNFNVNGYRKTIVRGNMLKTIRRSAMTPEAKQRAIALAKEKLGANNSDYIIDRIHKVFWNFIPGLVSVQNDRL